MRRVWVGFLAVGVAVVLILISVARNMSEDPVGEPPLLSSETTPDPNWSAAGGEGSINLLAHAKTRFDPWTKDPSIADQQAMRDLYEWMVVYSPYFDERLDWFPNGLAYLDLYAIYPDKESDQRPVEHPEWILQDNSGERVSIDWGCNDGTCPQWAADVGNPEFRSDFIERARALLDIGYPGLMIDDVNLLFRFSDGTGEVAPIDPRTGQELLLENWQRYVVELVEQLDDELPEAKIMHNSIWYVDSPDFTNPLVARQIAAADWIMLERGATDGGLTGGDGRYSLDSFLRFIDNAHGLGTNVLLLDESAETVEEQTYNLAAYLLANDGSDLVTTEDYPLIAPGTTWAGFLEDLGDARGPRYRWMGLWRRDFTGGVVMLNEPDAPELTVAIGELGLTLDGEPVSELSLGDRTAAILKDS